MADPARTIDPEFATAHTAWHEEVEARRTSDYGPLSVASLDWLGPEPRRFDGIPGSWRAEPDGTVVVEVGAAEELVLDDVPVAGAMRVGPLTGIESRTFASGALRVEVAARGGSIALRTRRPDAPDRAGYSGTATFSPDPAWVIEARFIPAAQADVEVDTVIPGSLQHYDSPGLAEFEVAGETIRLILFESGGPASLRAIFADATGADLTFPAARNVPVARSGPDTVVIDFNRATNPPCAYSAHATCPLPPHGNRVPVRIEAGELRPGVVRA